MPLNPRSKGKRGEYHVRDLIRGFGYKADRTPMSGAIEGWKGDITSPQFPFFLEVKNTEKTTFYPWYKKAMDQSGNKPPLVVWVYKGDAYAFLLFSDLLQLTKEGEVKKVKFPIPAKKQKTASQDTAWQKFSKQSQIKK